MASWSDLFSPQAMGLNTSSPSTINNWGANQIGGTLNSSQLAAYNNGQNVDFGGGYYMSGQDKTVNNYANVGNPQAGQNYYNGFTIDPNTGTWTANKQNVTGGGFQLSDFRDLGEAVGTVALGAGAGLGLGAMVGAGAGAGATGAALGGEGLGSTVGGGMAGAGTAGTAAGVGTGGGVLSKAALDGTTAFGANSAPGAYSLGGGAAAGGGDLLSQYGHEVGNYAKMGSALSSIFGGSGGSGNGNGYGNLATLGGGVLDYFNQKQAANSMLDYLKQRQSMNDNMYAPGSPEYNALWNQMSAQDAAAGRNSQYGTRSVDLAAKIAQMKMNANTQLTSSIANDMAKSYNQRAAAPAGVSAALGNLFGNNGQSLSSILSLLGNNQYGTNVSTNTDFYNGNLDPSVYQNASLAANADTNPDINGSPLDYTGD